MTKPRNCQKMLGKTDSGMVKFCNKPLTEMTIGWACKSCLVIHDDDNEIWCDVPTIEQLERLMNRDRKGGKV